MYNIRVAAGKSMARKSKENEIYRMPKGFVPGTKRMRGQPIMYDEPKQKMNLNLTPTAINRIRKKAANEGISCSELVERWAREEDSPDS